MNKKYVKAILRRAMGYEKLKRYAESIKDLTAVCLIEGTLICLKWTNEWTNERMNLDHERTNLAPVPKNELVIQSIIKFNFYELS